MVSKSRGKKVRGLRAKAVSSKKAKDIRGGKNDYFLKLDGIKGESQDKAKQGWIDIFSW